MSRFVLRKSQGVFLQAGQIRHSLCQWKMLFHWPYYTTNPGEIEAINAEKLKQIVTLRTPERKAEKVNIYRLYNGNIT